MHHLNIDIETYSSVDIKTGGLYKYAQAPDFEILLFAWSLDGGPAHVVDLAQGEAIPDSILSLLFCKDCLKHAYNAAFEWYCLCRHFKHLPFDAGWLTEWRDTMLHGLYCGYTAGLAATGEALGLPQDKRKLSAGSALIRTFCVPRKPTARNPSTRVRPAAEPEKWRLFKEYNAQDVVTEQEIERRLSVWPVPDAVQKQWETDILINARGVAVDLDLVRGALACSARVTQELTQEAVQISGLDNPNSVAQLSRWLEDETGAEVADLRKDTVARMLADGAPSEAVQRMLEIRQELGKTSNKKYAAMDAGAGEGGRVRGLLQFYGANRTGRWAGRLVQVQNLPRTHLPGIELARERVKAEDVDTLRMLYGSVPDTLSQLIRTALVPAPGHRFVDADFSAIEARVIAWLSGEEWVLDVFRTHGKIYEATASQMFGVPLERIKKGNPEYDLRQKGKVATLALGYQGGVGALINMGALSTGIPEDELPGIVQCWRQANRRIVAFWYAVEAAATDVVRTGRPQAVGRLLFALQGDADTGQWFLTVTLPSGRVLFYAKPFLAQNAKGFEQLHYYGMNQTSKKWGVQETYGGKLVENITQAVARDCLAENIERLEAAGYPVVFHVHDEVVIETETEHADLSAVCDIMARPIPWAPDLPLKAEGWTGGFYTKD